MSMKRFVIELRGGTASGRRTLEALDLATALAAHGHTVELLLRTAALARLASARGDTEFAQRLEDAAAAGLGPALTDAEQPPDQLGGLAIQPGDPARVRAAADATIAF